MTDLKAEEATCQDSIASPGWTYTGPSAPKTRPKRETVSIPSGIAVTSSRPSFLSVTWQACHQGLCLPARTESVEVFAPAQ